LVCFSVTAIQTLQELQKVLTLHIKKQQSKGKKKTRLRFVCFGIGDDDYDDEE
jgi:hypothetical protein